MGVPDPWWSRVLLQEQHHALVAVFTDFPEHEIAGLDETSKRVGLLDTAQLDEGHATGRQM